MVEFLVINTRQGSLTEWLVRLLNSKSGILFFLSHYTSINNLVVHLKILTEVEGMEWIGSCSYQEGEDFHSSKE